MGVEGVAPCGVTALAWWAGVWRAEGVTSGRTAAGSALEGSWGCKAGIDAWGAKTVAGWSAAEGVVRLEGEFASATSPMSPKGHLSPTLGSACGAAPVSLGCFRKHK